MSKLEMKFELSGKNAIVTGGTGILGQEFCKALASSGANVIVSDLDEFKCKDLASELQTEYSIKSYGFPCDVSDPNSVRLLVEAVEGSLGDIDILHNNAATKTGDLGKFLSSFEDYDLETWREVMSVNLDGMFLVAQAVGRHMVARKIKGSIIQTCSIYGVAAPDQRIYEGSEYMGVRINTPAVYSASKAGVLGLSNYLASYWGDRGIRVNTLTPGGVSSGQNEEFDKKYSNRVPLGRMAQKQDMLGALVFLASDSSLYITGQNIVVDGGLTVW